MLTNPACSTVRFVGHIISVLFIAAWIYGQFCGLNAYCDFHFENLQNLRRNVKILFKILERLAWLVDKILARCRRKITGRWKGSRPNRKTNQENNRVRKPPKTRKSIFHKALKKLLRAIYHKKRTILFDSLLEGIFGSLGDYEVELAETGLAEAEPCHTESLAGVDPATFSS